MSGTRRRTAKAKANASPAMNFDISSCSIVDQLSQLHLEEPTRSPAVPSQDIPQHDLLDKEVELVKLQKEKMALELEVLWLRQSTTTFSQPNIENSTATKEQARKRTIDWPQHCVPGVRFSKLPKTFGARRVILCGLFTKTDSIFVRFKS